MKFIRRRLALACSGLAGEAAANAVSRGGGGRSQRSKVELDVPVLSVDLRLPVSV